MIRRNKLFVPSIHLDRDSVVPLHRQIQQQIANVIRSGAIHSNARLPSSRTFAQLLRVSRNTVLNAYEDLAAEGLIRGKQGAGMTVCGAVPAGPSWISLHSAIRASGYPARIQTLTDPDGNPLYLVT